MRVCVNIQGERWWLLLPHNNLSQVLALNQWGVRLSSCSSCRVEFGLPTGTQACSHSPQTHTFGLVVNFWLWTDLRCNHECKWLFVLYVIPAVSWLVVLAARCTFWFNFKVDWKAAQLDCFLLRLYPETDNSYWISTRVRFAFFLFLFFTEEQRLTPVVLMEVKM